MLREQDLRVNVTLNEASNPDAGIIFELGVVALAKEDQDLTVNQIISLEEDFLPLVDEREIPELQGGFANKPLHLFTIREAKDLIAVQDTLSSSVKTLVFTATTSSLMADAALDFDGVKIYTLKTDDPLNSPDLTDLAKIPHVCAFLDPEAEGKPLYTFSRLLSSYPSLGNQMNIRSQAFSSVFTTKIQRDSFLQAGFSFFLQSQSESFLWDVYAGGKQIQSVYSYLILQNQVGYSIAEWIKRGQPYTDDSLLNLQGEVSRDLAKLKSQGIIGGYTISMTWVANQIPEDKVKGIIRGFNVDFNEPYRIAQVNILINGEI